MSRETASDVLFIAGVIAGNVGAYLTNPAFGLLVTSGSLVLLAFLIRIMGDNKHAS